MEQNNQIEQDTPKIITKKSSGVRFVFTNILGDVGWAEAIICLIGFFLVLLTVALLVKVSLLAMFILVFIW